MPLRRFLNVPPGSILHYLVRVEPPGCVALTLDVTVNGVKNPPQVATGDGPLVPPLATAQIANRSPELSFGPVTAGGSLLLELSMPFLAAGIVAVVAELVEPGGGVQKRDPLVFLGKPGQGASADVSVRT